jgi:hypothetical protein
MIIGVGSLLSSNDDYILSIIILWLSSAVALLIAVYHISLNWYPQNSASSCFNGNKSVWVTVHVLFAIALVFSVIWAGQFYESSGTLRSMSGILLIILGLTLITIASYCKISGFACFTVPFWCCFSYLLIWLGLTLYTIIE